MKLLIYALNNYVIFKIGRKKDEEIMNFSYQLHYPTNEKKYYLILLAPGAHPIVWLLFNHEPDALTPGPREPNDLAQRSRSAQQRIFTTNRLADIALTLLALDEMLTFA